MILNEMPDDEIKICRNI